MGTDGRTDEAGAGSEAWRRAVDRILEADEVAPHRPLSSERSSVEPGATARPPLKAEPGVESTAGPIEIEELAARPDSIEHRFERRDPRLFAEDVSATLAAESGGRLEDLERRLEAYAADAVARLDSQAEEVEAQFEAHAAALVKALIDERSRLDVALEQERDRINEALEKVTNARRAAKRTVKRVTKVEKQLRDEVSRAAKLAAETALEAQSADDEGASTRRLDAGALESERSLIDLATRLEERLDAVAARAQERVEDAAADAERSSAAAAAEARRRVSSTAVASGAESAGAASRAGELTDELLERIRQAEVAAKEAIADEARATSQRLPKAGRSEDIDAPVRVAGFDVERESAQRVREAEERLRSVLEQVSQVEAELEREHFRPR